MKSFFICWLGILGINLAPIIVSINLRHERALISLESVFIFLLLTLKKKKIAFALVLLFIIVEFLNGFLQQYPLFNLRDAIKAIPLIRFANPVLVAKGALLFAVFALSCILGAKIIAANENKKAAVFVLLVLAVLINIPVLNNFNALRPNRLDFFHQNLFGSTSYDLYFRWHDNDNISGGTDFRPIASSNTTNMIWRDREKSNKILFIVVESWGIPLNEKEFNEQIKSLAKNKKIKILDRGSVLFLGGTVMAELRELCAIMPASALFSLVPEQYAKECLPWKLRAQGYTVISLHGAHSGMYSRNSWYPQVGFQESYFLEKPLADVDRCYSFPGFCDVDLMPYVFNEIKKHDKLFFYWMTLNSHAPYDDNDIKNKKNKDLCPKLSLEEGERCNQFLLIKEFMDNISLNISSGNFSGLEIIMVGDHKPPFFTGNFSGKFVDGKVPYLHLLVN